MALDVTFDFEKMYAIMEQAGKANDFIKSLKNGFDQYGSLTEKQAAAFQTNFEKFFDVDGNPRTGSTKPYQFNHKAALTNLHKHAPESMREKTKQFCVWYLSNFDTESQKVIVKEQSFTPGSNPQPQQVADGQSAQNKVNKPSEFSFDDIPF